MKLENQRWDVIDILEKREIYFHLLFWLAVLIYPFVKYIDQPGGYSLGLGHELTSIAFAMVPSYFLYLWFFNLEKKRKYWPFVILVVGLTGVLYYYIDSSFHISDHKHNQYRFLFNVFISYSSFGLFFFALHSIKAAYRNQKEVLKLKQALSNAEFKALKSQVNPHFLFNTLNSIYANSLRQDKRTPELILKLSNGLQYLLHDGQKELVTLGEDIGHLKNYIGLQEERLSNKIRVSYIEEVDNYDQLIAPLLLIAFVENAFKYTGLLKGGLHEIRIEVKLAGGQLYFCCRNPFDPELNSQMESEWKESGIGISNTVKRLDMLFDKRYSLKIDREEVFQVTLLIEL